MKDILTEFEVGTRLDKALALGYPQYSRSALEKLVLSGDVTVNGEVVATKYKLKPKDKISVELRLFQRPTPSTQLPIIYEDEDVVVVDKPSGVLTHAKGTLHNEATVATWLKLNSTRIIPATGMILVKEFWESNRAGIVHRLDRGTSGVMICAKHEKSQTFLQKQFANRRVKKTYLAVISGTMPQTNGLIDVPIERNPKKPATFRAGPNGKSAQTEFLVLNSNEDYSLVQLKPTTGRTHQIRVHLNFLKHPIVGDELYGGEKADRMMLHAQELEITLPSKARRKFVSEMPTEFSGYLK